MILEKKENNNPLFNHYSNKVTLFYSIKRLNQKIENLENKKRKFPFFNTFDEQHKNDFKDTQKLFSFLNSEIDKDICELEKFSFDEFIQESKDLEILTNVKIDRENIPEKTVLGNKKIIQSILYLLVKLQTVEFKLKKASVKFNINEQKKEMEISIPQLLSFNKYQKESTLYGFKPKYIKHLNRYFGIYLYFANKLAKKIDGKLKIEPINGKYKISLQFPVNIDETPQITHQDVKEHINIYSGKKILIYASSMYMSNKIKNQLNRYNFDADVEVADKSGEHIPNFINYDLAIIDSSLLNSNFINYLTDIKRDKDLKVLLLINSESDLVIANDIQDAALKKGFDESELYNSVIKLFEHKRKHLKTAKETENIELNSDVKILIADDDTINLKILKHLLLQYSIEVDTAKDGIEVLKKLENSSYDMIILDSYMPKMDGYKTALAIRRNKEFDSIPLILHSGFSLSKNSVNEIFKYGFDSYLPKPFSKRELNATLKRYLPYNKIKNSNLLTDETLLNKKIKKFLALFEDIDELLQKYILNREYEKLLSLLQDIKSELVGIDSKNLTGYIAEVEESIKYSNSLENSLANAFLLKFKNTIHYFKLKTEKSAD